METYSALLAICVGNSPVTGEFPAQRPVMRSFDVFFDLRLIKWLSKQWWGWWFEMPSHPLWCRCNVEQLTWRRDCLVVSWRWWCGRGGQGSQRTTALGHGDPGSGASRTTACPETSRRWQCHKGWTITTCKSYIGEYITNQVMMIQCFRHIQLHALKQEDNNVTRDE